MRTDYAASAMPPQLPDRIEGDGLLIGWSMEQRHEKRSIGFAFGDAVSGQGDHLVDPILFPDEGHLITIAATGAGKGIGCIVPALLRHKGPMIVIDPKGENAAVTRRYRQEVLGQAVHVIDPMGVVDGPSARLNPLDVIDPKSPDAVDEAAALADLLSEHLKSDSKNRYWHNRGKHLITALILNAVASPDVTERNLGAVRDHLNQSGMGDPGYLHNLLKQSPHPEARKGAGAVSTLAKETLGGIVSTAQDMVDFVRGDPVRNATSNSDISLDAITRGDPMTIYIVLPPHMLESHAQLLRLWVGSMLKAIMRRRFHMPEPTMLLLDEAAQLGEFAPLRQAITLLRGYGLQTWSFWQDVDQLKQCYPTSWRTIINNCRAVQAFGAPNMSAAATLAELFVLMRPEFILDLENDEMLLQISGDDTFIARRPNYLTDPAFAGMFDANPFYQAAPTPATEPTPVRRRDNAYVRDAFSSDEDAVLRDLLARFD